MDVKSPNFSFLETHDPEYVRVAASAESHCLDDPVAALTKIRTLGEMLAEDAAARVGVDDSEMNQYERLQALQDEGILPEQTANLFHNIRRAGKKAVHNHEGSQSEAVGQLKLARQAAIWFHRTFDLTAEELLARIQEEPSSSAEADPSASGGSDPGEATVEVNENGQFEMKVVKDGDVDL
jgi:hypothetical protein